MVFNSLKILNYKQILDSLQFLLQNLALIRLDCIYLHGKYLGL